MKLPGWALQAAVLKTLADEIETRLILVKEATKDAFTETGATQTLATLPDGTKVATVSLAGGGSKTANVTNEREFTDWVRENYPEEIVEVVRDNAKKKLLDRAKALGAPVDEATGEVIPGVTVGDSRPFVSVRFKAGGKDAVVRAWQEGALKDIEVLAPRAIEGGEGS